MAVCGVYPTEVLQAEFYVYTLHEGLAVETHTPLSYDDFVVGQQLGIREVLRKERPP